MNVILKLCKCVFSFFLWRDRNNKERVSGILQVRELITAEDFVSKVYKLCAGRDFQELLYEAVRFEANVFKYIKLADENHRQRMNSLMEENREIRRYAKKCRMAILKKDSEFNEIIACDEISKAIIELYGNLIEAIAQEIEAYKNLPVYDQRLVWSPICFGLLFLETM